MSLITDIQEGAVQHRSASIEAVDVTTREILVRAAPYGSEHDIGAGIVEAFEPGCFASSIKDPGRLFVTHEHGGPLIGRGIEAEDRADGVWIRSRIASTSAAREAMILVDEKVLQDVSVEFRALRPSMVVRELADGKIGIRHKKAQLQGYALVSNGAYGSDAYVAEIRSATEEREHEKARAWLDAFLAKDPFVPVP